MCLGFVYGCQGLGIDSPMIILITVSELCPIKVENHHEWDYFLAMIDEAFALFMGHSFQTC